MNFASNFGAPDAKPVAEMGSVAAEAKPAEGGGGFASELCKVPITNVQHALLPLTRCGGFRKGPDSEGT